MERNNIEFRDLKANEIDVRVHKLFENKGVALLLYKDARVDQSILDETVGNMNWQRKHSRDNANCEVGIWNEDRQQWVWKEDVGTESNNEAEKGLASDSFKRACVNWGIGRELYTSPFIWVKWDKLDVTTENGKLKLKNFFIVEKIIIKDKKITLLSIKSDKGERVFNWSEKEIEND